MLAIEVSPFELAIHSPDRFRKLIGLDPDEYLRGLGFCPATVREQSVKLVCRGRRRAVQNVDVYGRAQRLDRVVWERRVQALRSRHEMSRRRLKRLCRAFREVIRDTEQGRIAQSKSLRSRFLNALRKRRKDAAELTVASERQLAESCRGFEFAEET